MDKNYKNYRVEFDGFGIENIYCFLKLDRQRRDFLREHNSHDMSPPSYKKVAGEFFLLADDAKKLDKFDSAEIYYLVYPDDDYPNDDFYNYYALELSTPIMVHKGQKTFTNEATPRSHLMFLFDDNDAPQTNLATDDLEQKPNQNKSQKQCDAILEAIKQLEYDPMAIPDGGKSKLESVCRENDKPKQLLFGETGSSSFENAWRKGNKTLFKMANYDSFAKNH